MEKAVQVFHMIRDIHYRIPLLSGDEDRCCNGKHIKLKNELEKEGYQVRYRVCLFKWSTLGLPDEVLKIPHDDVCNHIYLEVKVNGDWKKLDATWDKGIHQVFPTSEWDGESDTILAVKPTKTFSAKDSSLIMEGKGDDLIPADQHDNTQFYRALNNWLEGKRKHPSPTRCC